jgi:hypothetical protein
MGFANVEPANKIIDETDDDDAWCVVTTAPSHAGGTDAHTARNVDATTANFIEIAPPRDASSRPSQGSSSESES